MTSRQPEPPPDTAARFSNRADDYVRHRPSYPAAAIDAILHGLREPSRIHAVDIGAGTGISTRLLADRGVHVIAIEPGEAMRAAGESRGRPNIEWRDGTAERTGLPDACADLVLAAQAFHWFRRAEALAEFHRVLKPGGRLALMWNARDGSDPLTAGYIQAILDAGGEHPCEQREFVADTINDGDFFAPPHVLKMPNEQCLDLDGLIGRAMSASYTPKDGERGEFVRNALRELYERFKGADGSVALRYETRVYLADRL
ncbi:MAG: class I SAM-dependent methyltransferase [Phycisphaerales bacterium]